MSKSGVGNVQCLDQNGIKDLIIKEFKSRSRTSRTSCKVANFQNSTQSAEKFRIPSSNFPDNI